MRIVLAIFAASITACCALAESASPVTLLVQFADGYSTVVFESMRQELSSVLETAGIALSLRDLKEGTALDEAGGLVVVRFHGACKMDALSTPSLQAGGALASTHSTNGEVLPFAEVACDRVRGAVKRALQAGQNPQAETLYGRALARVLAHEIYLSWGKRPSIIAGELPGLPYPGRT